MDFIVKNLLRVVIILLGIAVLVAGYGMFNRLMLDKESVDVSFSDIEEGSRKHDVAVWAVNNNIVRGYLDDTFRPNETISEKQMMVMLYSYFGLGDLKYITTMIDESNIEVKNVGEVYGKLRDAGIFVRGTNVMDGSVTERENKVSVREALVNLSKFFGDDDTSYKDFKVLRDRVYKSNKGTESSLDDNLTKIEFLDLLYVLDNNRDEYNNEIEVNKKLKMSERFWLVNKDKELIHFVRDPDSGVTFSIKVESNGYDLTILNSSSTPYEYFGYSVITYGEMGVRSVYDTESYVALGGTSSVSTKIEDNKIEMIVVVLGDQVIEISVDSLKYPKGLKDFGVGVYDSKGKKVNEKDYDYVIQHMYSREM